MKIELDMIVWIVIGVVLISTYIFSIISDKKQKKKDLDKGEDLLK